MGCGSSASQPALQALPEREHGSPPSPRGNAPNGAASSAGGGGGAAGGVNDHTAQQQQQHGHANARGSAVGNVTTGNQANGSVPLSERLPAAAATTGGGGVAAAPTTVVATSLTSTPSIPVSGAVLALEVTNGV
jgi:hypothetical protein